MPQVNLETLNCVYMALFFIGLGYAVFTVVTGGLSSVDMPDVDISLPQIDLPGEVGIPGGEIQIGGAEIPAGGLDAPDITVSPLSPITVATFITTFGGIGVLCTQFFGCDPRLSLVMATLGALLTSGLVYLFYSQFLVRSQGSSEVRQRELIGLYAEVTVPIGETALGQISYDTKAGRMSSPARSLNGQAISRGTFVQIARFIGQVALVTPIQPTADGESG